jgi:hypothetical protein
MYDMNQLHTNTHWNPRFSTDVKKFPKELKSENKTATRPIIEEGRAAGKSPH